MYLKFALFHANLILCRRVIEEISLKTLEYSPVLMQALLTLLSDDDSVVAKKSIVAGTHIFCKVLDELALQVFFFTIPFSSSHAFIYLSIKI